MEVCLDAELVVRAREELQAFNRELIENRQEVAGVNAWLPLQVNGTMQNLVKACKIVQAVRYDTQGTYILSGAPSNSSQGL